MGDNGAYGSKRKKRMVLIGVTSFLLIAMAAAAAVVYVTHNHETPASRGSGAAAGSSKEISASMKAIQSLCQPTDFKKTCVDSLSTTAGNTTDPKELIRAGFNAAVKRISEAAERSTVLQELEKDPRASQALQNCKELIQYAVSDLRRSFDQFANFNLTNIEPVVADLKTWLSAAITYHETCLDGFEDTTGNAGESMRKALNTSAEITRNGLAMVDGFSSMLTSLNIPGFSRRLLGLYENSVPTSGRAPIWVGKLRRDMMEAAPAGVKPDFVVAQDGSGNVKTVNEALKHIPQNSVKPFVLYVKAGIYNEVVTFNKSMKNVVLIGDGPTRTKITNNKNFIDGVPTFKTATVAVLAENFIAKNIGFENSAGSEKHQAVALRVQGDRAIFFNCQIDGYQDTLYVHAYRQFYRDCTISGTIDFIFGDGSAVFQNCRMLVRKPGNNQQCIVTAQGRKDRQQPTAIIIQSCSFLADPLYYPVRKINKAYLGRPWKEFSRTIIIDSFIDDLIDPTGWLPWAGDFALNTCFYTEFKNRGPGAAMALRVKWPGIKTISAKQAEDFTPGRFFEGDIWIAPTGVPYISGMTAGLPAPALESLPAPATAVLKKKKKNKNKNKKKRAGKLRQ